MVFISIVVKLESTILNKYDFDKESNLMVEIAKFNGHEKKLVSKQIREQKL